MPREKSALPAHKHCPVCGQPMGTSENFCSPQCEKELGARKKSQRRSTWFFMAMMAVIFLFLFVLGPLLLRRPGGAP